VEAFAAEASPVLTADPAPAAADLVPAEPAPRTDAPPAPAAPAPPEPAPPEPARTPPVVPHRASPAATVAWPAHQVAPFAVALALGPDASLTLTLDPGELGRVEVAIDRSGGEAAIRVTAERPETLALLQRDSRELEKALADAGFGDRAPSLTFSLGQGGTDRGTGRNAADFGAAARDAQEHRTGQPQRPATPGTLASLAAHPAGRRTPHRGLIDLAV
jgi:hypothetical protein